MAKVLSYSSGPSSTIVENFSVKNDLVSTTPSRNRVALIPAHNEARFIGSVVLQVRNHVEHVVVVDDGSIDSTSEIARDAGALVLSMESNVGKACAVSKGLQYIQRLQPSAVVMIDGDGQHNPAEILTVLAPVEAGTADIVIGSRFLGVVSNIPAWRVLGQHALTVATNLASGVRSTDSQSGFRAFSPHVLTFLEFQGQGFSIESEMQFIAARHRLRLTEVPISVVYVEPPKRNPIKHALQVLNSVWHLNEETHPLFSLIAPGLGLLLVGLASGINVLAVYLTSQQLAVVCALIAVLLSILGTIGLATGIMLHSVRALLLNHFSTSRRSPEPKDDSHVALA